MAREKRRAREKALKYIQRERSQQLNACTLIENDHKNISMISEKKNKVSAGDEGREYRA